MSDTAALLLNFGGKKLTITLYNDNRWEVAGDPKGVLDAEGGSWKFSITAGTELIADGLTQIVLVGWKMSDAENEGTAYLFPETANTLGDFSVTARA